MPKESFRHNIFFFAFVREPFITKCFVLIIIIIITIIYNKNLITNILYRVVNDWRHMYINPVNELLRFFFIVDSLFKRNSYNDPLYITHITKNELYLVCMVGLQISGSMALWRGDHRRSFVMYVLIPATDFYDCTILCCATKCPRHCLLSMAYEILKVL